MTAHKREHPEFIWAQSPNDPTLRRTSFIVPGYDRRDTDQGIHHDEWHYVISDGAHALAFHRGTNDYPATVKRESLPLLRQAGFSCLSNQMFLHSSEPMTDEQIRGEEKADECKFIEGGRCFNAGSWLSYADAVVMKLSPGLDGRGFEGWTTFERGEGFWKALELEFKELLAKALKERGEKTRCTHCGGTGIVGKGVEEPNDPWTRSPAL